MNEIIEKNIENKIYEIRGVQVMLDSDLARIYKCKNGTKSINLAVKRHAIRFPDRFMFQLNDIEWNELRFQTETTNNMIRTNPYAFTEQGVAMLSAVLRTHVADEVSVKIMDAFVKMRHCIIDKKILYSCGSSFKDLGKKCFSINRFDDKEYLNKILVSIDKI